MGRQLSIVKRFDLSDLGDEWKDCYINYRPLTPRDLLAVVDLETDQMDEKSGVQYMITFLEEHVTDGKVAVDGQGTVDFEKNDISSLPTETIVDFFSKLSGSALYPKDTQTAQTPSVAPTSAASS